MTQAGSEPTRAASAVGTTRLDYPVTALVLQGGGALGSYQAGPLHVGTLQRRDAR
jgi:predicted acylesterase/phospholipase RssA